MAAVGADVEQLRKAAQTFRQKAEYLESTITQGISRQITESPWKGADADSFRNQWQSDLAPKVRQVVEALRKSADSLTRNANEQEQASAQGGGSAGGGTSAGGSHNGTHPVFTGSPRAMPDSILPTNTSGTGLKDILSKAGNVGPLKDANKFIEAMKGGSNYEKFSTGVDLLAKATKKLPKPLRAIKWGAQALKWWKAVGEESARVKMSGPWPKGVSVWDALVESSGEKRKSDPIGRKIQYAKGAWNIITKAIKDTRDRYGR